MRRSRTGRMELGTLGLLLLGLWLIVTGLLPLLRVDADGLGTVLAILALGAGVLLLASMTRVRLQAKTGFLLLAIWLVLQGAMALLAISFSGSELVMPLLALAAGVLIIINR